MPFGICRLIFPHLPGSTVRAVSHATLTTRCTNLAVLPLLVAPPPCNVSTPRMPEKAELHTLKMPRAPELVICRSTKMSRNTPVKRTVPSIPALATTALPKCLSTLSPFLLQQWHTIAHRLCFAKPSLPAGKACALPSARRKNRGAHTPPSPCGNRDVAAARSCPAKSHSFCKANTVFHVAAPSNSRQLARSVGPQRGVPSAQCSYPRYLR